MYVRKVCKTEKKIKTWSTAMMQLLYLYECALIFISSAASEGRKCYPNQAPLLIIFIVSYQMSTVS